MAILQRKERVSDEIPTASMADIAFLLLVFFLTTTVFNEEKGLPIVLPEESEEQDVSAKNIISELAANENLIAAIKTDPFAPYKHMINVLDEVKLAGAERISLQMLEE